MLEVSNLSLRYGKHLALDKVSLNLCRGETVVILGANGAGKSSIMKALGGLVKSDPCSQAVFLETDLLKTAKHQIVDLGIALVPEGRGVFEDLSVADNLLLGANPKRSRATEKQQLQLIYDLFPRLAERRKQLVCTMSGGEQQMVAIGRAIMSNPDLLMLDEPSLGLAPILVGELFSALRTLQRTGISMLIVEQNVRASLAIANRGYLLEAGRVVGEGTADELLNDSATQKAFLGASH